MHFHAREVFIRVHVSDIAVMLLSPLLLRSTSCPDRVERLTVFIDFATCEL